MDDFVGSLLQTYLCDFTRNLLERPWSGSEAEGVACRLTRVCPMTCLSGHVGLQVELGYRGIPRNKIGWKWPDQGSWTFSRGIRCGSSRSHSCWAGEITCGVLSDSETLGNDWGKYRGNVSLRSEWRFTEWGFTDSWTGGSVGCAWELGWVWGRAQVFWVEQYQW